MNLENLKKEIPYQWRVQSFSAFNETASCVAYIDARDVMNLLDEVCGAGNWASDFKDIGGQTFAGIGIRINDNFVWKWDTGSESNIEKEKGQASDSLKRAGVQWGIGRFLYDLKVKTVKTNEKKTKDNKPYVIDENGKRVWDLSEHINSMDKKPAPKAPAKPEAPKLSAKEQAMLHIEKANTLEALQELNERIAKSTAFGSEEKKEIIEKIMNKLEILK